MLFCTPRELFVAICVPKLDISAEISDCFVEVCFWTELFEDTLSEKIFS